MGRAGSVARPRWKDLVPPRSHQNFHHDLGGRGSPPTSRCRWRAAAFSLRYPSPFSAATTSYVTVGPNIRLRSLPWNRVHVASTIRATSSNRDRPFGDRHPSRFSDSAVRRPSSETSAVSCVGGATPARHCLPRRASSSLEDARQLLAEGTPAEDVGRVQAGPCPRCARAARVHPCSAQCRAPCRRFRSNGQMSIAAYASPYHVVPRPPLCPVRRSDQLRDGVARARVPLVKLFACSYLAPKVRARVGLRPSRSLRGRRRRSLP